MSLGSATNRNNHTGDGSTTAFSYTFKIFADADLEVTTRDSGTTTDVVHVLTTDYTVTGAGLSTGGTVTFVTAPANNALITIRRVRSVTQSTDLKNQATFQAQTVEDALDHGVMLSQQQQDEVDRSFKIATTADTANFNTTLPADVTAASSYLKAIIVNAAGTGLDLGPVTGVDAATDTDDITYNSGATSAVDRVLTNRLAERVSIFDFGAVGDGTTDDSAAIALAVTHAKVGQSELYCPSGYTIKIDSAIDLTGLKYIDFQSDILVNSAIVGTPVVLGKMSNAIGGRWWFRNVTDGTAPFNTPPARPIVDIRGSKSIHIKFGDCNYLRIKSDSDQVTEAGNAYCRYDLDGVIDKLELATNTPAISWINENTFIGGRLIVLIIDGTDYPHNHNKFIDSNFEGTGVDIQFKGGAKTNYVLGARFELVGTPPGITFESEAQSNIVEKTATHTGNPKDMFINRYITVTDNGVGNAVTTAHASRYRKIPLFEVSANSGILATASRSVAPNPRVCADPAHIDTYSVANVQPGLNALKLQTFRYAGLTELIPVSRGDIISFEGDYDGTVFRPAVFVYGSDQEPLTSEGGGGVYIDMTSAVFSSGVYRVTADLNSGALHFANAAVNRTEVKFVRVGVFTGTADSLFRSVSAFLWSNTLNSSKYDCNEQVFYQRALDSVPTQGYVAQNTTVPILGGLARCTQQVESTVDGAIAAAGTSCTIDNNETEIANGDIVGLLMDNEETHWTSVSSLASKTFTIDAVPAGRSVPDGSRVVFNRWTEEFQVPSIATGAARDGSTLVHLDGTDVTLTGTQQFAVKLTGTHFNSSATAEMVGMASSITTPDSAFSTSRHIHFWAAGITHGTGHTTGRETKFLAETKSSGSTLTTFFSDDPTNYQADHFLWQYSTSYPSRLAGELTTGGGVSIANAAEGYTGKATITTAREVHTLANAATSDTTMSIPSGAMLLGASFNVNTAVVDDGGDDTWSAAFITGSTTTLATAAAAAQDTKVDLLIVPEISSAATEVRFTANGGNFTAGVIEVVVYYMTLTSLASV